MFLEGIGQETEHTLWKQGIEDWHAFLEAKKIKGISEKRKYYYDRLLHQARRELYSFNASFFTSLIPLAETWRLYDFFKEEAVFLDIETAGMNMHDDITVVGLYDGITTKTMVRGINLNYQELKEELSRYSMIVTFNGATFDLPYLKKRYPELLPHIPHVDLRTVTARLGYHGGLKSIEKEFSITRRELVSRLHGGDAVTLWRMYYGSGDDHYLKLLIEYNEEDVINLKKIADICTKRMEHRLIGDLKEESQDQKNSNNSIQKEI